MLREIFVTYVTKTGSTLVEPFAGMRLYKLASGKYGLSLLHARLDEFLTTLEFADEAEGQACIRRLMHWLCGPSNRQDHIIVMDLDRLAVELKNNSFYHDAYEAGCKEWRSKKKQYDELKTELEDLTKEVAAMAARRLELLDQKEISRLALEREKGQANG